MENPVQLLITKNLPDRIIPALLKRGFKWRNKDSEDLSKHYFSRIYDLRIPGDQKKMDQIKEFLSKYDATWRIVPVDYHLNPRYYHSDRPRSIDLGKPNRHAEFKRRRRRN